MARFFFPYGKITTMKKIVVFIFMLGAISTFGQVKSDVDNEREILPPKKPDLTGTQQQYTSDYYNSGDPLIIIRKESIPASMRKTLEEKEYLGWENSPIFRDRRSQEYLIDIRSGDSLRTFRFDKSGSIIKHRP
jgi:hypothetical protein